MKIKLAVVNHIMSLNRILQLSFPSDEFDLVVFSSTDELFEALPEIQASLILLNRSLLDKQGTPPPRSLPAQEEYGNIPVIALQDAFFIDDGENEDVRGQHWDGLCVFPFDPQDLVEEVRRLAGSARLSLPLPEEPAGQADEGGTSEPDLDRQFIRLANRLWDGREEKLKTEIFAALRREIRQWERSGKKGESENP